MRIPCSLALFTLLCLAEAHAAVSPPPQELPPAYAAALRAAGIPAASASVVIRPLDAEGFSAAEHASLARSPASTMKLVTTWSALNLLGPAYTWRTEVATAGSLDAGILQGDLVFRGSGDPTLVIESFWLLVQRIRATGIREIRGDLLLDKAVFVPQVHDPGAFDGDALRPYNAGPDALLLNFKTLSLDFVPDAAAGMARIVATPRLAGLRLQAGVPLGDGACGNWLGALRPDVADPLAPVFLGTYPRSCGTRNWSLNLLDHTTYFAAAFRALWEDAGGTWTGRVLGGEWPEGARLVAAHESAPLSAAIRDINKYSNNVMTRQLLLTLGAQQTGQAGSTASGAAAVHSLLQARGTPMPELVLENGSGLSRIERIAPANLAAMLVDAFRSPLMPEFMASLPIMGVDGTTRKRPAASGAAHIKTGQLVDVCAIAGYVHADSGRRYVIVAIVNHANAGSGQRAHDVLLEWLRREG